MATQSGLTGKVYYGNNRVLLKGTTISEKIGVKIESPTETIVLNSDVIGNAYEIDISKAIRYILKNKAITSVGGQINSYEDIAITVTENSGDTIGNYVFIAGGLVGNNTNIQASNTTILHTLPIPVWDNYESKAYHITNNSISEYAFIESESAKIPVIGCNSIYVRYKNSLGGISQWLFERAEIKESTKSKGELIDTPRGYDVTFNLELVSRVHRDFQYIVSSMIYSDIIRIQIDDNFKSLFPTSIQNSVGVFGGSWINAKVKTSSIGLDYDTYKDISITLELESNYTQGL